MKRSHRVYDAVKRLGDILVAAVALVILSPFLLITAVVVRTKLGSPVIFKQQRPGRHGKPFTIYKFRTMLQTNAAASDVAAVATDADRLTRTGRVLRAASLDELPELWNVLVGDMSIVGPRPLLTEYLERYNSRQARRHEVRPGITGWAQVNGRNALSWDERLEMDVWYVDHRSLWLDLRVIGKTFSAVFGRRGISSAGHATQEPFNPEHTPEEPREDS